MGDFAIIEGDVVIRDSNGNAVGVVLDGSTYRLEVRSKLRNPGDTADMGDVTTPVRIDPTGTTEQPVSQGTKAAGTGAWPTVLYDASGNAVGVVLDGAIYRLQAQAKLVGGSSNVEVPVAADASIPANTFGIIATGDNAGTARRLQMRATNPIGTVEGVVTRDIERTNATYYAVYDRITLTTNKYVATLFNTSSTRKVVVQRIYVINWQFSPVQGGDIELALYRITARTAGTTVNIRAEDTSDTLSSGIAADTNSTAVTQDHLVRRVMTTSDEVTFGGSQFKTQMAFPLNALQYERRRGQRGITLRENQGISLQYLDGDPDGTVSVVYEFTDEVA